MQESFPDFRRYLQAKARLPNLPVLAWYDLTASVGDGEQSWSFDTAVKFIIDPFGTFSPKMANLARRTALQRETPTTLAETASTFCQTIVQISGLQQVSLQEQITLLDATLQFTTLTAVAQWQGVN